ncbi:hypothetical protein CONLIGDRAFT_348673 [Coniochaeta ligniaria NRRL 30616]|uniref:Uncharacterized protein n=1 Tax=Coniochaeta ligniaria NRRL 30616 TaxID=1408157 RepID=A0A1J7JQ47_9PEZI|nr:hypothetical protein CONLIGDRAFT_348673 [Coniochaeta ligniaria NRRL 30616]
MCFCSFVVAAMLELDESLQHAATAGHRPGTRSSPGGRANVSVSVEGAVLPPCHNAISSYQLWPFQATPLYLFFSSPLSASRESLEREKEGLNLRAVNANCESRDRLELASLPGRQHSRCLTHHNKLPYPRSRQPDSVHC